MKKIIILFCFVSCLILCYFIINTKEDFIVAEYKPQSAYIAAKKDNIKQETQNVIYIDTPKIYFHSLDYPNQWWQGESPITFTKRKNHIVVYESNPCKSLRNNLIAEYFISYFFNDSYKPKKVFKENEKINVRKGTLFEITLGTYDLEKEREIKPSEYMNIECGKIVFDNISSINVNFQLSRKAKAAMIYAFSNTNDIELIKSKMQNSKKYYVEIVLSKEINSKIKYFKGRWFFGDWK